MKYFKNEYPNNIIIFDQDTNKVVCRLMHYDFNNEEEAIQQAEAIVNSLNKEEETEEEKPNYTHAIFKDDAEETKYLIHEIKGNTVLLGQEEYPEIEQDFYTDIDLLNLIEVKDLFEFYEDQPENVKSILAQYEDMEEMNYEELAGLQKNLETIGYTFDYGLDAIPTNLRKI